MRKWKDVQEDEKREEKIARQKKEGVECCDCHPLTQVEVMCAAKS